MSDILKRKLKEAESRELYKEIREEKTHEILETGRKWIVTADGIPICQETTEVMLATLLQLKKDVPSSLERLEMKDILLNRSFTAEEFLRKYSMAR